MQTELPGLELGAVWGSGKDIFAAGHGRMIARSIDGGKTWATADTGVAASGDWPIFRHVAGSGGTDVWLVGSVSETESVLLHSSDRGASWQVRPTGDAKDVRAVWAVDASRVVIGTHDGSLFVSDDGGGAWARVGIDGGPRVFALWGSVDGELFAAGGTEATVVVPTPAVSCDNVGQTGAPVPGGETGVVLRSPDGGLTWGTVVTTTTGILWNVWGTPDARVVVAAGAHATVALTTDHGTTWLAEGRAGWPTEFDLADVWIGPGDASFFFATSKGIVRNIEYDCHGPLTFTTETLPMARDGSHATMALWGPGSDDIWAVGPGGIIRHRP